ncbi:MAG: 16S rRNA (adenine(1518)-N(6)/adenine(1519)-N(6))-dimethyltransferase RsmA [Candidatus Nanohaloarchaea archaeon]|nr:16S rRNA (adenine(1518)-N(6)/adenine(1519)-N(6))-dimethyltransferase RsmA [Candidatus Nanohaloarchaea archaeon]
MIKQILNRYGFSPDRLKGQHFLNDERLLEEEVEEAEIGGSDTVLEIGGGLGTLTRKLAERAGKVHTVEKDPQMVEILEKELSDLENVEIHSSDVLDLDLPDFDKCVSNPPYQISSSIIEMLGRERKLSVLTFQKQFAKRLVASPGSKDYSRISVRCQMSFIPVYLKEIPASSFLPEPEVDSALVKLYPRNDEIYTGDEEAFNRTIRALFTNRRKKIRNAFVDGRHILNIPKQKAKRMRDRIPHSEDRVNNLEVRELAEISEFLEENLW